MDKKRKRSLNTALFLIALIVSFALAEMIFRVMIFSHNKVFEKFRNPGDYADYFSEDLYWKLYYRWDGKYKPPVCVQPELGWIGNYSRYSLIHNEMEKFDGKRPVLLYGDSYAACSRPAAVCFEEILNNDNEFSQSNYLYNYGTGGYGLDQIYMLFDKTWKHYEKPFVVFSLFIHDMDRVALTVRTGQKPYFIADGDSLKLMGVPLEKSPEDFFSQHPPRAFSYLFRKFLFSELNFLGKKNTRWFLSIDKADENKMKISRTILKSVVDDLRQHNADFIFLVFHILHYNQDNFGNEAEHDWRNVLLKDFFKENDVPYLWSKDIIQADPLFDPYKIEQYMIPEDGHPTTHLNMLIADKIKEQVSLSDANRENRIMDDLVRINRIELDSAFSINTNDKGKTFFDYDLDYYKDYLFYLEKEIRLDAGYMELLKEKAVEKNLTLDETIRSFAMWLIYDLEKDCR